MNIIAIKGRVSKDIELRTTTTGKSVCTVDVAVDRGYGDNKSTDFFTCVFWEKGAEFVSKYFSKGQEIIVTGEMQSRHYEDKNGNKRIAWEIGNSHAEFCGSKAQNGGGEQASNFGALNDRMKDFAVADDDGELPF